MTIGIYKITNEINGKTYVGQSINIERRWKDHINKFRSGKHKNSHFQRSWDKYGCGNFSFTIIEECQKDDLDTKEHYWIIKLNCLDKSYGYNLVEFSITNKQSQETKDKISKSRTGMKFSKEHCANMSLVRVGKATSEETRRKRKERGSFTQCGEKSPNAKITEVQAQLIVDMLINGVRITNVSKFTGINYNVIKAIKHKRSWRHLTSEVSFPMYNSQGVPNMTQEKVG